MKAKLIAGWLVAAAILTVILTDPIAIAFLSEWWLVIAAVTLLVVPVGAISFLCGYTKGKKIGHCEGYRRGEDYAKGIF